jgi:hypothetical protein
MVPPSNRSPRSHDAARHGHAVIQPLRRIPVQILKVDRLSVAAVCCLPRIPTVSSHVRGVPDLAGTEASDLPVDQLDFGSTKVGAPLPNNPRETVVQFLDVNGPNGTYSHL